jgi:ribonuclease P protein component
VSGWATQKGLVWLSSAACCFCFKRVSLWTSDPETLVYTDPATGLLVAPFFSASTRCEADLPAERTPAKAQARLPCADVDARRARDHQAAAGPRPEAPFGVGCADHMHRRNRLSRSRDFDAVYRHGRSVSTRFLTLYWFAREDDGGEPRVGLSVSKKAVPSAVARNRIKRRLRELWRARLDALQSDRDYVLIVRPGLAEAAEEQGAAWLGARIEEVLGKAAA